MNYKHTIIAFGLIGTSLILTNCNSGDSKTTQEQQENSVEQPKQDAQETSTIDESNDNSVRPKHPEPISIDTMKIVIENWNDAINSGQVKELLKVYTPMINYYGQTLSSRQIVLRKKEWLNKHQGYKQKIEVDEIRYYSTTEDTIHLEITKYVNLDTKPDTVYGIMELIRMNDTYLILAETDKPSERLWALRQPKADLPYGEYSFINSYYLDTRRNEYLAQDFAGYDVYLELYYTADSTFGKYSYHSGSMHETFEYYCRNIKVENGFLEYDATYWNMGYEPEDLMDREDDGWKHFKYKIINENFIVLVDADNSDHSIGMKFYD